jgi:competence CoiA-like predicted nuclease
MCPLCSETVIAKCGEIKIHHWAHEAGAADCDPWGEPETLWHRRWKESFSADCREIVIGSHRADIKTPTGWIIEFQNSTLSPAEIREREQFYRRMIWIVNGDGWAEKHFHFRRIAGAVYRPNRTPTRFRWKYPRKTWQVAKRPVFIDLDEETLLLLKKVHHDLPCGGWGILTNRWALKEWLQTGHLSRFPYTSVDPLEAILERQNERENWGY